MTLPAPLTSEDYEAIAAAVMETERGRWFLQEFARRNRAADTAQILDALAALEGRMTPAPAEAPSAERLAAMRSAASDLRAALVTPAPAERRVALALESLADLEQALDGAPIAASGSLLLPPPTEPEPPAPQPVEPPPSAADAAPRVEAPAMVEPFDEDLDLWLSPAPVPERPAAAAPPAPAPEPAPEEASAPEPLAPRRPPPLLESLTEVEKALLFA